MRVEWSDPDEAKREVARRAVQRDMNDRMLDQLLAGTERDEERRAYLLGKRYPDLEAVIVRYGTLLSVRYSPAQYGVSVFTGRGGTIVSETRKLCEAQWFALVATETGFIEMNPLALRPATPPLPHPYPKTARILRPSDVNQET